MASGRPSPAGPPAPPLARPPPAWAAASEPSTGTPPGSTGSAATSASPNSSPSSATSTPHPLDDQPTHCRRPEPTDTSRPVLGGSSSPSSTRAPSLSVPSAGAGRRHRHRCHRREAGGDVLVERGAGDGVAVVAGGELVGGDADRVLAGGLGDAEAVGQGDVPGPHHRADLDGHTCAASLGGDDGGVAVAQAERRGVGRRDAQGAARVALARSEEHTSEL